MAGIQAREDGTQDWEASKGEKRIAGRELPVLSRQQAGPQGTKRRDAQRAGAGNGEGIGPIKAHHWERGLDGEQGRSRKEKAGL